MILLIRFFVASSPQTLSASYHKTRPLSIFPLLFSQKNTILISIRDPIRGYVIVKSNESSEDYLETILILSHKLPVVRSVDIANEMGFRKSSVSIAMKNLRERGHITVTDAGYIYLTESGKKIADTIYERHEFLTNMLTSWGVDRNTAETDACRIEHVISAESFKALKEHFQ
ncbi:MAG: metal-dependent transcriptional regulator [Lachnospiraceae bacterium]|nr:metal-dependent transcriptional regulator [Lachnospiraceae bacterium]MBR3736942.1 metal-dependent transcriptional regulator [Lachnospiraceae bacterium]